MMKWLEIKKIETLRCDGSHDAKRITEKNLLHVRNSFISIYFFLTPNFFFPRTLILLTHVLPFPMISLHVFPFISFRFHHSHQVQTIANISEVDSKIYQRQELSTREALRQAPSPIQSRIARLRRLSASTPTPPRTCDEILYHEESSPRGLPMSTIPHDGMKRR